MATYYLIEEGQLEALRRAARRLYTEDRMSGDEMRDMAHSLSAITGVCSQLPVPEEAAPK